MSSSTLQASLLLRPPPLHTFKPHHRSLFSSSLTLRFNPQSLSSFYRLSSTLLSSRFHPLPCSLRQDNVASDSDFLPKDSGEVADSAESRLVPELATSDGYEGTISGGEETEGKEEDLEKKSKFKIVVLMMGVWAAIKRAMEKVMEWEWLSWWPFSRQEKRLEKLIAEADANPKDAALQGALLAELNKHMYALFQFQFLIDLDELLRSLVS